MLLKTLNRYCGVLVGVHVGDALGAPYERMGPDAIAQDIIRRGGLRFFNYRNPWPKDDNGDELPAGRPTDDSDQTADLAASLVRSSGLDVVDLRHCLRDSVIFGKSRLWYGKATGAGGTTRKALSDDPNAVSAAYANTIGTNGSLMRAAPMGLYFGPGLCKKRGSLEGDHAWDMVRDMSKVTHAHAHSIDACWTYTRVLVALLRGYAPHEALWTTAGECTPLEIRVRSRLSDPHDIPYDPGAWPARGTAEFSLYVALYALMHTTSFEEGIEMAIRVGGDTDTYAAIAGGLLGARYGYCGIPESWINIVLGHDQMVNYATALYEMRRYP